MTDAKSLPDPVVLKGWKSYSSDTASGAQGDSMQTCHMPGKHAPSRQPMHMQRFCCGHAYRGMAQLRQL